MTKQKWSAFFVLLTLLIIACDSNTNQTPTMKGPKVKNQKPWQNKKSNSSVNSIQKEEKLTGPQFKNQNPKTTPLNQKSAVTRTTKKRLIGPKAKNQKP